MKSDGRGRKFSSVKQQTGKKIKQQMNQQPTAILLLFTDYLNNRDSIAFLRLSSSIWSSHRSPAGRYRLKPISCKYGGKFLRPSKIPSSFIDSPSSGYYFSDYCLIENLADFLLFFPAVPVASGSVVTVENSVTGENSGPSDSVTSSVTRNSFSASVEFSGNGKRRVFHKIQQLAFRTELIENLLQSGHKFPESIKQISISGYFNNYTMRDFLALIARLPAGIERIEILILGSINGEGAGMRMDFSGFDHLIEIVWNLNLPLPILPSSLKILQFDTVFSQEIPEPKGLPEAIEKLSVWNFNHPLIDKLPRNLKILELGNKFNEPIRPGQLPAGLKTLKLSLTFNDPLELGVFPQTIETIDFSDPQSYSVVYYSHPILPGLFPDSLKNLFLRLSNEYEHPILPGLLPEALESLDVSLLSKNYCHPLPSWPSSLKSLFYDDNARYPKRILEFLPHQLRTIKFGRFFNSELRPGVFPPSMEIIEFGNSFQFELRIGIFPAGLKKIRLGDYYDHPLPVGIFPEGISSIELGNNFSPRLEVGLFPSSVKHLIINTKHPLPLGLFPEGVETIEFGRDFDEELLPGLFPSSLRSLKFGQFSRFGQDFLPGCLPEFLYELQLNYNYSGIFPSSALPPYFLPDSPVSDSDLPHRLKSQASFDETLAHQVGRIISRIGRDRQFLVKSLRVPISFDSSHVLIHPLNGDGEDFIVCKTFLDSIFPPNEGKFHIEEGNFPNQRRKSKRKEKKKI